MFLRKRATHQLRSVLGSQAEFNTQQPWLSSQSSTDAKGFLSHHHNDYQFQGCQQTQKRHFGNQNKRHNSEQDRSGQTTFKNSVQQLGALLATATISALAFNKFNEKEGLLYGSSQIFAQAPDEQKPYNMEDSSSGAAEIRQETKLAEGPKRVKDQEHLRNNSQNSAKESLEIPKMLAEREAQKKREYAERAKVDANEILNPSELKELKVADKDQDNLFMETQDFNQDNDIEDFEDDDEHMFDQADDLKEDNRPLLDQIKDPYVKKKTSGNLTPQQFRQVTIGPEDMLKDGQMLQVAISDPFNKDIFHPTDKVIVLKHKGQHYALGSYCGFDFTNLARGALLGEKLICPTCCSSYDIKSGIVDIGPTMRNIASFNTSFREGKVQVTVPEHIPAFAKKKYLGRAKVDPRVYVVLGDSETALAAIDALRTSFTGEIVCIPASQYGHFENTDILKRKIGQINKNEAFYTDQDFLDKANVTVMQGQIKSLDKEKRIIRMKGNNTAIAFDKVLFAVGHHKKRLDKEFTNVFYLEDRFAHAKCHNELLKAKQVVVVGGTLEAYQQASSIRAYLDTIGASDTEILIINDKPSEVAKNMGPAINLLINNMLREQRISVIMNATMTKTEGDYRIERMWFKKAEDIERESHSVTSASKEYFVEPDVVIVEDGVGQPKISLKDLVIGEFQRSGLQTLMLDNSDIPMVNMRFHLQRNDLACPYLAAGSCTHFPSFFHKQRVRTDDVKYNIEAGFFAAMNMMDKKVDFKYVPMFNLKIGEKQMYFVGEREQPITEVIWNGKIEDGKWIAFFVYGDEVAGFLTCGYQNLHIYLLEAMKQLIMPPASMLRATDGDFTDIVNSVLQMRPHIEATRQYAIKTPSVIRAEFTREIEKLDQFRGSVNQRMRDENQKQQAKMQQLKQKFDKEGIQYVEDESQMGKPVDKNQQPMSNTNLGPKMISDPIPNTAFKKHPSYNQNKLSESVNMGFGGNQSANPVKSFFKGTNNLFGEPKGKPPGQM